MDGPTLIAFVKPSNPCEQAWADLYDQKENADVERIIAGMGGWEQAGKWPLTYEAFRRKFVEKAA